MEQITIHTQMLNVWYIYLHGMVYFYGVHVGIYTILPLSLWDINA